MAEDPYALLGVGREASQDEIKRRYRALAKELHPDLNPDKPEVADRFKEITAAYDLLSDADKRARFDKGEIDASGQERPQQFYRDFADDPQATRYYTREGFGDADSLHDLFVGLFGDEEAGGNCAGGAGGAGGRRCFRLRELGAELCYSLGVEFIDAA
jgi:DnaJ-class molecular chaperone